jgi:hypothetical protein
VAILEENTQHYSAMVTNLPVSIGDFLRGHAFAQMGLDPNAPVVLNQAQRHSAWEMKQVRDLSSALFDGLLYNPKIRKRALDATQPGNKPLYDPFNPEILPPYLNNVEAWCADGPSKNRKGATARPIEILDGQQRSFSLRAMTVWMLAKKANLTGEMDPILLDVLMRPEGGKWTPRVQFDLGENAAGTWENNEGQQGGALNHLLAPLAGGTRADPKTVATQIQSRLERDLKPAANHSTQATLILRMFKQMDQVWHQLEQAAPKAAADARIDAIATCMLRAALNISLPSPHMNPVLRVHNHNTTGLHFNETETIRSYLVEKSQNDPSVSRATHQLEADALALGKSGAHEIEKLSYAVAMALSSDDLSSLSMKAGKNDLATKDRLATLLNKTPDPQAMAKTIAQHLPAALNAVCLAKVGKLPPSRKSKLPEDVQALLVNYASLKARGVVSIAAWMAIAAPDQVRKILPFVSLATASNHATTLLPKVKGTNNKRFGRAGSFTDALDGRADTWIQRVKNAKTGKSMGAHVLFEVLTEGKTPYAGAPHEDLLELFRCLNDSKNRNRFIEEAVSKKNHELSAKPAAVFRTLLDLSAADIAAGVELVNGKQTFCIIPGRPLKNKLESPNAIKIDISTTGVKRLEKTRKDILAGFGGGKQVATTETYSEKLLKEKRLAERQEDIRSLVKTVISYWKKKGVEITPAKEDYIPVLQSKAKQLAKGIRSNAQWKIVVSHPGLIEKVYNHGAHTLDEAEQKIAIKSLSAGFRARNSEASAKLTTPKPRR